MTLLSKRGGEEEEALTVEGAIKSAEMEASSLEIAQLALEKAKLELEKEKLAVEGEKLAVLKETHKLEMKMADRIAEIAQEVKEVELRLTMHESSDSHIKDYMDKALGKMEKMLNAVGTHPRSSNRMRFEDDESDRLGISDWPEESRASNIEPETPPKLRKLKGRDTNNEWPGTNSEWRRTNNDWHHCRD
ncbi:hypothetical protein AJ80_06064 [Polytolypa hystricis UAMH7299]|uniref:GDP/GTP exchange factor Sec2 N-terminal domain-containing protein n=1 Tax=Polytolypa hystricis (strain UAMH7299) TaxID=1447883 RepID=A0A2B7XYF8_POLH7|nr:hypothetical protein AJ80_06064 [Polytolypa hystricis UAMH7299]